MDATNLETNQDVAQLPGSQPDEIGKELVSFSTNAMNFPNPFPLGISAKVCFCLSHAAFSFFFLSAKHA